MSPVSALCILTLLHHATASYIERRVPQDQLQINVTKASSCHHRSRAGDTVTVHYNGSLTDGTVFDSSYDRDAPIEFTLGAGQVIQGWDEGLLKMCPGEERHLTIPSNLAYGDSSMGAIPPGATLIFDTLLVAVKSSTESAPDQEAAFGIQTAPAKDPAKPEPTSRPKPVEQDLEDDKNAVEDEDDSHEDDTSDKEAAEKAPAPGKSEEAKPKINDIMTFGPAMPTRLPDLPVTGLQGATSEAAAVASQQPIPGPPPKHPGHQPDNKPGVVNGECRLLGPFALIVQGGLGILALSSLVFKRWRERPRRPFKIWFFDASKQVFGSALLHVLNLLMSIFSTADFDLAHQAQLLTESFQNAQTRQVNPCSWYLINIAIDTTIGIPILVILLKLLHHGFALTPLARPTESIKSGHYGQPPRVTWWLKQSLIYFVGLALMKLCVFFIIQLLPWIVLVGDWALRWTEGNTTTQVAFVMFVFPLIMNALQYYIIDSFIKDQSSGHELLPSDEGSDGTQSSYHTIDARDSLDSEDSDRAKEATRHAGQAPESETFREERSPTRGPRLKDA